MSDDSNEVRDLILKLRKVAPHLHVVSENDADAETNEVRAVWRGRWQERLTELLQAQADLQVAQERIAAVERDRALLLAYVRADERLRWSLSDPRPHLTAEEEMRIDAAWNGAHQALIDAGLLEGAE